MRHRFSIRYDERVDLDNFPLGKGITGAAVEQRAPVRVQDTNQDPRYIASHPGIRSEVAIPLMTLDRVSGVMDLESERVGYFTDDHVRMLMLLAPQIASSVENARLYEEVAIRERRMEEDLQAARELQSVMLPTGDPGFQGLEVAAGLRPARGISGDIYDFFEAQDHRAVLAFGDVSGKGAAAALYGALVSGLLRSLAPRRTDPRQIMRALNEALIERKVEARYVTLLVMLWSPAHPPVRDGQCGQQSAAGVPQPRNSEAQGGRRAAGAAGRARIRRSGLPGAPGRYLRAVLRRRDRSPEPGRARLRPHAGSSQVVRRMCERAARKPSWRRSWRTWTGSIPLRSTTRRCWC